jgi:hypothetical protein
MPKARHDAQDARQEAHAARWARAVSAGPTSMSVTGFSGYCRRDMPGQGFRVLRHS